MDNLKAQIKVESRRVTRLSQEALSALAVRNFDRGKALMKEAVIASKECQKLIQKYTQNSKLQT